MFVNRALKLTSECAKQGRITLFRVLLLMSAMVIRFIELREALTHRLHESNRGKWLSLEVHVREQSLSCLRHRLVDIHLQRIVLVILQRLFQFIDALEAL